MNRPLLAPAPMCDLLRKAQMNLFDESKHPRYPEGHPKGGEFMAGHVHPGSMTVRHEMRKPENLTQAHQTREWPHTYVSVYRPFWAGLGALISDNLPPDSAYAVLPDDEARAIDTGHGRALAAIVTADPLPPALVENLELVEVRQAPAVPPGSRELGPVADVGSLRVGDRLRIEGQDFVMSAVNDDGSGGWIATVDGYKMPMTQEMCDAYAVELVGTADDEGGQ